MAIVAKRTIMSLYSNNEDIYSHQVRIVLAEKGVNAEIISTSATYDLKLAGVDAVSVIELSVNLFKTIFG